jgi:hypothetical protein
MNTSNLFPCSRSAQQPHSMTGYLCLQMTLRRINLPRIVVVQHGENKMRTIVLVASLICGLVIPELASAMPMAPSDAVVKSANQNVVHVSGGCGPRRHRGPRGGCRWN